VRTGLRLHGQALSAAVERLRAQPFATLLSVLVIAIAIALPVVAAVVLKSLAATTAGLDTEPHVNVYLALDATDEDARKLEPRLRAHPDAATVRFVPREQALQELKATTHLAELLGSLERNPLPHAFTVRTRTTDGARLDALRAEWQKLPKVDQVVADFEWSERLSRWVRFGDRALAGVAAFLALAVIFIVGHLIRLQVLTQREEIEVSQLIGATAGDVRRPFLYHGVLQGLLAGAAALALAAAVAAWLRYELQALTSTYAAEFKVVFVDWEMALAIAVSAALLGLLGAWVSVSRELRSFAGPGR
jgi:cell division transport system permease protein